MRKLSWPHQCRTLSEVIADRDNNFDLLRLIAALLVMVGHSYGMQNPTGNVDYIRKLLVTDYPGSIAVYIFFTISGVLIYQSFERAGNPINFIAFRVARLWPGLILNTLVIVFLIGPFFSTAGTFAEYFSPNEFSPLHYLTINIFHIGETRINIENTFMHSIKTAVNYPLWSLTVEAQCYCVVLILGVMGMLSRKKYVPFLMAVLTALYLAATSFNFRFPYSIFFYTFSRFKEDFSFYPVPFFFLGMVFYALKDKVILNGPLALVLVGVAAVLHHTALAIPTFVVALAYLALTTGGSRKLNVLRPKYDYSYGLYIYGFICQQMVHEKWPFLTSYSALAVAVSMAVVFSAISWHLVEGPCLRLCRRWASGAHPATPSVAATPDSTVIPQPALQTK